MGSLITNRIKFDMTIPKEGITVYCTKSEALFRLKYQNFIKNLKDHSKIDEFKNWFGNYDEVNIEDQPYVYYSFQQLHSEDSFSFVLSEYYFRSFKKKFVNQTLINHFQNRDMLIEPYLTGLDLSIYVFSTSFDSDWDKYSRYDFIIKEKRNEIIFNKTRENVLISKAGKTEDSFQNIEFKKLKGIESKTSFIKKVKYMEERPVRIIGIKEIRPTISPTKVSYKHLFSALKKFYLNNLLALKTPNFNIQPGGFVNVVENNHGRVYKNSNVMVFKDTDTDINAATGMRKYGYFKPSPIANDVQFIFIYENSDDANKLYQYLKNGFKHFPGLQAYAGIPPTLADLSLKYDNQNLKSDFNQFLLKELPNDNYENYFVIFIGHLRKNYQTDNFNESELYYYIKKELLKKSIASQFIFYQNIRSNNFHYYLPNIAIAILAKLGGIPWKLKEHPYKELIIGFNAKKINEQQYIGSSVFFDNQGYIRNINSYEGNDLETIVTDLSQAIEIFRNESSQEELKRIIIHTYKPYGKKEKNLEKLIRKQLQLDIPFVFVEINDSKTKIEVCFDESYNYGMPISGTYVKTGHNEYLLFNNTRYHEKPERFISEEWPIKLRIFSDSNSIDEKQLISQVYEFSRLYWRGLKQKRQPVTTLYSKFVAEYRGNFDEPIPKNKTAQERPWFL